VIEQKAIEKAIEFWERRVVPPETRELTETVAIQTVAMFYLNGFHIVPAKGELKLGEPGATQPFRAGASISREEVETMLRDGVAY
jgi:hypothetical protein